MNQPDDLNNKLPAASFWPRAVPLEGARKIQPTVPWEVAAITLCQRAKSESHEIGDQYVGTQHLLLAESATSPIQGIPGFDLDSARTAVKAIRGPVDEGTIVLTPWSQTPRFKRAVEYAQGCAACECRSVTCVDVWFALLADSKSECLEVIRYLGLDVEKLRGMILSSIGE